MEGHRHERAAIVLASYVIGFTTAFILYAHVTSNDSVSRFISVPAVTGNTAAVADAVVEEVKPAKVLPIEVVEPLTVTYAEGRLEVRKGDEVNLLSFNAEESGIEVDTAELTQGFHFGDITYVVSPNDKFVFFCEQQDVTNTACLGFVYDIAAATIYPVVKNGAPVLISEKSLADTEFDNSGLTIGSNYSANPSAPWVLIDAATELDLQ